MLEFQDFAGIIEDLLRAELSAARSGDVSALPPGPWSADFRVDDAGLGADSLEQLRLAGAVNEMFHIHETGVEDTLLMEPRFGDWVDLVCRAWPRTSQRISFRTSGSLGKPKRCTHHFADLAIEAMEHAERINPTRVLAAVPAHHIYGFIFTVLLPKQANCAVLDIRHRLPPSAAFCAGDVIISFPDHWQFILRSMAHLPEVTGVTSTSPMPLDLACALRDNGLGRLIEIYGSSETAGIAWRDEPNDPFQLLNRWKAAEESRGDDQASCPGPLRLTGQTGQTVLTPDEAVLVAPRSFTLHRRTDGAVQVGGLNIFPKRIADILARHPLVAHARVRLASANDGGRLKALIVPQDVSAPADDVRQALRDWMRTHLAIAERPRSLTIASCLPKGMLGKECDWSECE